MAEKLWARRSYITANYVVSFGYYVGALPVKWNNEQHAMQPVSSPFNKARWILTIVYNMIWQIAITLNFIIKFIAAEDKTEFILKDHMRIFMVGVCFCPIFMHFHTAWKYKQFATFINRAAKFYEHFQNKYAKDEERLGYTIEDTISGFMKLAFLVGTLSICLLSVTTYLFQCRTHFLSYLFPICKSNYPLTIKILHKIIFSIFQFHFFACQMMSFVLYVDLFVAVIVMGVYIVKEMREMPKVRRRTTMLILEPKEWLLCYRSLDLIVKELNSCIGEVFMPIHMLFIVIMPAVVILFVIRHDLKPMIFGVFMIILFLVILYYVFLMGRGSSFSQQSAIALKSMTRNMRNIYFIRRHRSCQVLKPDVGGLFSLKRQTVATMYQSCVELTADLLLMH